MDFNEKQLKELTNSYMNNNTKTKNTTLENTSFIKLPWVPVIGPKLRKELRKQNVRVIFTSPPNLKSILCNHKSKLLPNSNPGVYQLKCTCGSIYIGETKKRILTRCIEHQQSTLKGEWTKSGATEHSKNCHGAFNWLHPKTISINKEYHDRKIRESLEINLAKTKYELNKENPVMNRDNGERTSTHSWKPLFQKMIKTAAL